ncbi:Vacuolar protein sorting-associated protein 29 [Polyrhizophydium stewartii]|uniref:Vacuolar protein sorting-associated protein 29 n=1 Tax=Polyrhizophydium stewartii TaxID=2732419 RepID=A0ABR4MY06_9FUNG|nr:Vacuolar protein sorting-associated protein 29 [Polyrhizophydium stewartii]
MLVLAIGDLHIPHRAIDLPAKFKKLLVPGKIQQILSTGNLTGKETYDYLRTIAPDVVSVRGDMDEFVPPSAGAGSDSLVQAVSQPPYAKVVQHGALRIGLIHGHQVVPWGDADALGIAARQLNVDVLVSGHTHAFDAFEHEGRFFVNPGSATGAFTLNGPRLAVPAAAPAAEAGAPATHAAASASAPATQESEAAGGQDASKPTAASPAASSAAEAGQAPGTGHAAPRAPLPVASLVGTTPSFVLMDIQGSAIVLYVYKLIDGEVKVEKLDYVKRTAL